METKHTPGPWVAAIEHGCHAVIAAVAGEPKAVAIVGNRTPDDGYEATRFANARLIAAAPELLDALETMLMQFTKTPSTLKDSEARVKAHAAIAKATGQT